MDPHDYVQAIRKRWIVIALLGVIGAGAGYGYASTLPDSYQSTSSVFVSSTQGATTSELVQGSTYTQNLVKSYAELATTPRVLTPVIATLGLDSSPAQLAKSIQASAQLDTVIIDITVTDADPVRAAEIANSVSQSLTSVATAMAPQTAGNTSSISMEIVTPAQASLNPVAPNRRLIQLSGLAGGLALGVLYALGRTVLDTRIRSDRDIERISDVPVIGQVERNRRRGPQTSGITMRLAPHSLMAEDYRRVRTNLEFADVDNGIRSITVTSAVPGEGKTTMAINIALAMAERSQRVLLIDADLRRPSVANYAQIEGSAGLTTVLVGSAQLDEVIQPWAPNLDILTSGVIPPNPNQLLGSAAMARLMTTVLEEYDFVIVDTPPILPASDALTLAHMTDGALVVTLYNSTTRQKLDDTLQALAAVRARTIGVVINQSKPKAKSTYYGTEILPPAPQAAATPAPVAPGSDTTRIQRALQTEPITVPSGPGGAVDAPAVEPAATAERETRASVDHGDPVLR